MSTEADNLLYGSGPQVELAHTPNLPSASTSSNPALPQPTPTEQTRDENIARIRQKRADEKAAIVASIANGTYKPSVSEEEILSARTQADNFDYVSFMRVQVDTRPFVLSQADDEVSEVYACISMLTSLREARIAVKDKKTVTILGVTIKEAPGNMEFNVKRLELYIKTRIWHQISVGNPRHPSLELYKKFVLKYERVLLFPLAETYGFPKITASLGDDGMSYLMGCLSVGSCNNIMISHHCLKPFILAVTMYMGYNAAALGVKNPDKKPQTIFDALAPILKQSANVQASDFDKASALLTKWRLSPKVGRDFTPYKSNIEKGISILRGIRSSAVNMGTTAGGVDAMPGASGAI